MNKYRVCLFVYKYVDKEIKKYVREIKIFFIEIKDYGCINCN